MLAITVDIGEIRPEVAVSNLFLGHRAFYVSDN